MNSVLVCLALLVACTFAIPQLSNDRYQFLTFQKKFNRTYVSQDEYEQRFSVFQDNLKIAAELQAQDGSATFGVTKFSDLTREEFAAMYLTARPSKENMPPPKDFSNPKDLPKRPVAPNPTTYDWSQAGVITPVYNQGQCGSCWAFSATETIESYWALAGNALTQLSMEQIVDCDTTDGGCGGGWPSSAYTYVQGAGGIDTYSSYPYTAGGGQSGTCQFNQANVDAQVTGQASISGESGLYAQASTAGPVSVCVDASSWQYYTGGVLTTCTNNVDHCVQLTGYTNYGQSGAYWNVRNSWAANWGENGYIWIAIGQDLCAIGDYATVVSV